MANYTRFTNLEVTGDLKTSGGGGGGGGVFVVNFTGALTTPDKTDAEIAAAAAAGNLIVFSWESEGEGWCKAIASVILNGSGNITEASAYTSLMTYDGIGYIKGIVRSGSSWQRQERSLGGGQ